jgi:hypothetical protein
MPDTLDLFFPNGRINPPHIIVENPLGVVDVGGYRVEVERRVANGVASNAVRFTAPDGDAVNVCWRAGEQQKTPKAMLSGLTSTQLGRVFDKMTAATKLVMAQRVQAVIQAAQDGTAKGLPVGAIRVNITFASMLLTQDLMDTYKAAAAPLPLMPATVALMRDNGIPPELASTFYSRYHRNESEYVKYGPYAQNGWTGTDFEAFCNTYRRTLPHTAHRWPDPAAYPPKAWSTVSYEHALLGFKAGMKPAEVRRLVDAGEWNAESVELLAAFR